MSILTVANAKTMKGEEFGYKTYVLHLAPAKLSGFQVCPKASAGCRLACLNTAGMGKYPSVQFARVARTLMFFNQREMFMRELVKEIKAAQRKAAKEGLQLLIRPNGTSDIPWEKIRCGEFRNIFEAFPEVQFYDYTKILGRTVPSNYHLTFSKSESNDDDVLKAIGLGMNVAVVFDKLPATYLGRPVVSGDDTDIRINDPAGVIVGLKPKGSASKDTSGFVVRSASRIS